MDDRERIKTHFAQLVERFGHDYRGLDYGRPESQQVRFAVLAGHVPGDASVLDVGCGFADFADWLEKSGKTPRYTGIDLSPDMIRGARERRPDLDLREGDPFSVEGQWDVVVANGVFYLLRESPTESMQALITRMFELCSNRCVFSSLSSWGPAPEEGEFCADPLETVAFCRTLTPWVELDHAYFHHDFAVVLHREPRRDASVD